MVPKPGHTFHRVHPGPFLQARLPRPFLDTWIRIFRHTVQIPGFLSSPGNYFNQPSTRARNYTWWHSFWGPLIVSSWASLSWLGLQAGLGNIYPCGWEKTETRVVENVASLGESFPGALALAARSLWNCHDV